MFLSLIKLFSLFIFIYFLFGLFKMIFRINKGIKNKTKDTDDNRQTDTNSQPGSKIIELDKDQYKVE
jgi:hypothetical protein